jgi:hypothetical protein
MDFQKLLSDIENSNQSPQAKDAFFRGTIKLWQSFEISQGRSGNVIYKGVTYTPDNQPASIITPALKTMELIPLRAIDFKGELKEDISFSNLDPNGIYWSDVLNEFVQKNYPTDADIPDSGSDDCDVKLTYGNCTPPNGYELTIEIHKGDYYTNPRTALNFVFKQVIRSAAYNTLRTLAYNGGWQKRFLTNQEAQDNSWVSRKYNLYRTFLNWIRITQWDWSLDGRQIKEMIVDAFRKQWERDDITTFINEIAPHKPTNYEQFVDEILPFVAPDYFIDFLNGENFEKVYVDCPTWVSDYAYKEIVEFATLKKQDWLGWMRTTTGTPLTPPASATPPTSSTPPAPSTPPTPPTPPTRQSGQRGSQRSGQRGGASTPPSPPTRQGGQRGGQRGGGSTPPPTPPTPPRPPKPKKKKLELSDILTEEELRQLGLI